MEEKLNLSTEIFDYENRVFGYAKVLLLSGRIHKKMKESLSGITDFTEGIEKSWQVLFDYIQENSDINAETTKEESLVIKTYVLSNLELLKTVFEDSKSNVTSEDIAQAVLSNNYNILDSYMMIKALDNILKGPSNNPEDKYYFENRSLKMQIALEVKSCLKRL